MDKKTNNWIEKETISATVWSCPEYPGFRIVKTNSSDYFTVQCDSQIKGSFESVQSAKNSFWFKF